MKKTFLLAFLVVTVLSRAANPTAAILGETKLELIKSKGSIVLKKGDTVEVVGRDGDTLEVVYRNLPGHVPVNKTDFKGEIVKEAAPAKPAPKPTITINPPPATAKTADSTATVPAPSNRDAPQSMYGKMVKKARDNEAQHKDNLVDPTNDVTGAKAKQ